MKRNPLVLLVASGLVLTACAGRVTPAPGATFSGPIEISGKASSGTISFAVSDDGASITDLSITLSDVRCDGLSVGRIHDYLAGPLTSMTDGEFSATIPAMGGGRFSESENYSLDTPPSAFPAVASLETVGQIEGEFSSATQASGTIKIYMWVMMTDRACELGVFPWSAAAP